MSLTDSEVNFARMTDTPARQGEQTYISTFENEAMCSLFIIPVRVKINPGTAYPRKVSTVNKAVKNIVIAKPPRRYTKNSRTHKFCGGYFRQSFGIVSHFPAKINSNRHECRKKRETSRSFCTFTPFFRRSDFCKASQKYSNDRSR